MNKLKKYSTAINNWPQEDRPREKLFNKGEHTLTNTELIAILLRTGVKGQSAIDLARSIMQKFKTFRNMSHTNLCHWRECRGLGPAKIAQVKTALEIGRRFSEEKIKETCPKIVSSKDVVDILMLRMRDLKKEIFKIILLNSKNRIISIAEMQIGTVNRATPIMREIFQKAIEEFAASIICVHNHPSGNPDPSREDIDFTKKLYHAGMIMDINILDHVIIGNNKYFSFLDKGLM